MSEWLHDPVQYETALSLSSSTKPIWLILALHQIWTFRNDRGQSPYLCTYKTFDFACTKAVMWQATGIFWQIWYQAVNDRMSASFVDWSVQWSCKRRQWVKCFYHRSESILDLTESNFLTSWRQDREDKLTSGLAEGRSLAVWRSHDATSLPEMFDHDDHHVLWCIVAPDGLLESSRVSLTDSFPI